MTREDFILLLDEILELAPGTLTGAEQLEDLAGWNSLGMMSFIAAADEHCQLTLSPRHLMTCRTVDDLLKAVQL